MLFKIGDTLVGDVDLVDEGDGAGGGFDIDDNCEDDDSGFVDDVGAAPA